MTHGWRPFAVALLAATIGVASCSSSKSPSTNNTAPTTTAAAATNPTISVNQDDSAFYVPPSPLAPGAPGAIIRSEVVTGVTGVPTGATVYRILYHSRSIYDADIAVSGYVIAPPGAAPASGRTVLAWAHGTTGITPSCDPSLFNTFGPSHPYLVPGLADFLSAGYVVAASDYEGLGGLQPYLLGESEGRGVLDAARATHHLPGVTVSPTTLVYGHSQGGHAALFAGELAPTYAPDLNVVGVAAAAPATNLTLIVSLAGTAATQGALSFQIEAAWSWVKTYNDLPAASLFTPEGAQLASSLVAGCLNNTDQAITAGNIQESQIFKAGLATDQTVIAHTRLNDPGRVRTAAPILVVQGTADTTVPPSLTDMYVQQMACPIGDTVDYQHYPGATHQTIPDRAGAHVLSWMADRVLAHPAPNTCGSPGETITAP